MVFFSLFAFVLLAFCALSQSRPEPFGQAVATAVATGVATDVAKGVVIKVGNAIAEQRRHVGNSHATDLEIVNDTPDKVKIVVSEVDNHDWDGDSRPDHKFNNKEIDPQGSLKERLEINAKSSKAMSSMAIVVDNEEKFKIRVDQWDAMGEEENSTDKDFPGYTVHAENRKPNVLKLTIKKKP